MKTKLLSFDPPTKKTILSLFFKKNGGAYTPPYKPQELRIEEDTYSQLQ